MCLIDLRARGHQSASAVESPQKASILRWSQNIPTNAVDPIKMGTDLIDWRKTATDLVVVCEMNTVSFPCVN